MMTETEIDLTIEFLQALKTAETSGKPYCVQLRGQNGWFDMRTGCLNSLSLHTLISGREWRIACKPRE